MYADFECVLIRSDEPRILYKHEPDSAAYDIVNTCKPDKNKLWSYVGKDSVRKLIIELYNLAQACIEEMKENKRWI